MLDLFGEVDGPFVSFRDYDLPVNDTGAYHPNLWETMISSQPFWVTLPMARFSVASTPSIFSCIKTCTYLESPDLIASERSSARGPSIQIVVLAKPSRRF